MKDKIRVDCPNCDGDGMIDVHGETEDTNLNSAVIGRDDCPVCQGAGKVWGYSPEIEYEPEDE
jgi:DnaJ-class molecular chaperone